MGGNQTKTQPNFIASSGEYFREVVQEAMSERKVQVFPLAESYLVNLLEHYMLADNLFEEEETGKRKQETLAEMFLRAANSSPCVQRELLKRLGDTSLYISGFFGDSLKRKIVDIDYYVDMGGSAYGSLAAVTDQDLYSKVYLDFSQRFLDYVDVLTFISQKSFIQSEKDLLRLYDRYISTGSKLAEEQLVEKGMLHGSLDKVKNSKQ